MRQPKNRRRFLCDNSVGMRPERPDGRVRTSLVFLLISALSGAFFFPPGVSALETFYLAGKVTDKQGKPVEGAQIYVYTSGDTKRPADFISPKSDKEGRYGIKLPAGRYWAVARARAVDRYGPLAPGDRHSGEPEEIEPGNAATVEKDFIVKEISDFGRMKQRTKKESP